MLKTVIYTSAASPELSEDDLNLILEASRSNNEADGLTGMLLHAEGSFIQVLEGDAEIVDRTYKRIIKDSRHQLVMKLYEIEIEERNFPNWSMGCRIAQSGDLPPGLFELTPEVIGDLETSAIGVEIFALLKTFYRNAYRFEPV